MTDLADSKREILRSAQPFELGRLECHGSLLRAGAGSVRVIGFLLRLNRIMVQLIEDTKPDSTSLLRATTCRRDAPAGRSAPRRSSWQAAACRHTRARRRARPSRRA